MAAGRARAALAAFAAERARRRCRPPALKVAERAGRPRQGDASAHDLAAGVRPILPTC